MSDSDTRKYAIETAQVLMNPFSTQASGSLSSPDGDSSVRLYTAKGGSAITLLSTTATVVFVYDPEAAIRNGRLRVVAYERNSSNVIINQQVIFMGRDSSDFLAAGIVSSGLKLFNSSGVDTIGGTQTAAVLNSVPRDVSTLTSSDVSNFSGDHIRDLAYGVVSRDDATVTVSITEHFGSKKCLARTNTLSNVVRRAWDDGQDGRALVAGSSLTPVANYTVNILAGKLTLAQALANLQSNDAPGDAARTTGDQIILDTNSLTEANNPLTLATYAVDASITIQPPAAMGANEDNVLRGSFHALDANNNSLAEVEVAYDTSAVSGVGLRLPSVTFDGSLRSSTSPIHRVIFFLSQYTLNDIGDQTFIATQTNSRIIAYEETADIPGRPIHVAVFEGLNAGATINVSSSAVIAGIPDSANVFIGSHGAGQDEVYDLNATHMFLRSVAAVMPRAFTVAGHGQMEKMIRSYYQGEEVSLAFKAFSFKKVGRSIRDAGKKAAKMTVATVKTLAPVARDVAKVLKPVPIPQVQAAAIGLESGADLAEAVTRGDAMASFRAGRRMGGAKKSGRKQAGMMGYEYATGEEFPDEYEDYADMM